MGYEHGEHKEHDEGHKQEGGHHGGHGHGHGGHDHKKGNRPQSRTVTLLSSEFISPESKYMRFALNPDEILCTEVESNINLSAVVNGQEIGRHYSPVSSTKQRGSFDLVIKIFGKGGLSEYLHNMKPGDTIQMMGPRVKYNIKPNQYKRVGMVAGGVGITSLFQVAQELLTIEGDKTEITLLHAARHEVDLALREKVEELQKNSGGRFKVHYLLSQPGESWKGLKGHLNAQLFKEIMPAPAEGTMIMCCGPDNLCDAVCGKSFHGRPLEQVKGICAELGYTVDMAHCF